MANQEGEDMPEVRESVIKQDLHEGRERRKSLECKEAGERRDRSRSPINIKGQSDEKNDSGCGGSIILASSTPLLKRNDKRNSEADVGNISASSVSSSDDEVYNEFEEITSPSTSSQALTDHRDSGVAVDDDSFEDVSDDIFHLTPKTGTARQQDVEQRHYEYSSPGHSQIQDLPPVLHDVSWLEHCEVITQRRQEGLSVREALFEAGVCATELIMETLKVYPGGYHFKTSENWFSKTQVNNRGMRHIMPRIGFQDFSQQDYKKVYNSLQRFSGTYIFLKHALDHDDFPEELRELQRKAQQLRHLEPHRNTELMRCQGMGGRLRRVFPANGSRSVNEFANDENHFNVATGALDAVSSTVHLRRVSGAQEPLRPLRDANQVDAAVRSLTASGLLLGSLLGQSFSCPSGERDQEVGYNLVAADPSR